MIRRVSIVLLVATASATALLWARSFANPDKGKWPVGWDTIIHPVTPRKCIYLTSLSGWVRAGSVSLDPGFGPLTPYDRNGWVWLGLGTLPAPYMSSVKHLGGLILICNFRFASGDIRGIALPHWLICLLLFAYPTVAFIRGPLRRYRRRKPGLCIKCGYNLTGNESGVCPECGTKIEVK